MDELRRKAVRATLDHVRSLAPFDPSEALGDEVLAAIRGAMIELTSQSELWPAQAFATKIPPGGLELWEQLSVDADGRLAMYLWYTASTVATVPHDHQTWVIVAGIQGTEFDAIYGTEPVLHVTTEEAVGAGDALAMQPTDIHSVVMDGRETPVLQLHLYGLDLPLLKGRSVFDAEGRMIVDGDAVPSMRQRFELALQLPDDAAKGSTESRVRSPSVKAAL